MSMVEQDLVSDTEVYRTDKGTSTSKCPDYSQLHIHSMARIAAVYEEGEPKHGRDNWKNGVFDEAFKRDRWNHAMQHLKLAEEDKTSGVDHIAKVGWYCDMIMEIERLETQIKNANYKPFGEAADTIAKETIDNNQPTTREEIYEALVEEEKENTNPVKNALSNLLKLRR